VTELEQARKLGGAAPVDTRALAIAYMSLDRLPEAGVLLHEALAGNPERVPFRQEMYLLAFLQGDRKQMKEQIDWAAHRPGAEAITVAHSDTEAYFGRLGEARRLSQLAEESALSNDFKERAALLHASEALREAEFGNREAARAHARDALKAAPGRDAQVLAALSLARTGNAAASRQVADHLNASFPSATLIKKYWLPAIGAELEIASGHYTGAIDLLQPAERYEMSSDGPLIPAYIRGRAYLRAKQPEAAATEFRKVLQHRGIVGNNPVGALAHLELARAYAASGDTSEARAKYQEFLMLWKDADRDIPILKEARSELAKIGGTESPETR